MKILVVGDTHCDVTAAKIAIKQAVNLDVGLVFQVGDFGFNLGASKDGQYFLDYIVHNSPVRWEWINGNHDNTDWLKEIGAFDADEPTIIAEEIGYRSVTYIPNSHRWTWEGLEILGVGGAYSIDRHRRTLGVSWWEDAEYVTDEVLESCRSAPADIVFAHDCPEDSLSIRNLCAESFGNVGYKNDSMSKQFRYYMQTILEATEASAWFHGHYHHAYIDHRPNKPAIIGTDCNGQPGSSVLLEIVDGKFRYSVTNISLHSRPENLEFSGWITPGEEPVELSSLQSEFSPDSMN